MITRPPCDEGVIRGGGVARGCPRAAQRWTLVAAILGSALAFIDGTVANVALPALQQALGANAYQAQWVIESYALTLAALLLIGGALGDRFGRRRVFMLGVLIFTGASVLCGLSGGIVALIAARAVQGVGAALMVPGSLALISAAFPQAERGAAIGTWSAFGGVAAAIGPLVGGYLIDRLDWTWAFLVNAPPGLLLLAICALKVPADRPDAERRAIDVAGALLATAGLAGVVFALIEAPSRGWTAAAVWGSAAAGLLCLAGFVRVQARARAPMLPLGLFRSADFTGANVLTLLLYAALGGGLYYLPLNLIQVQGLGATAAGAAMLPFIALLFVLSRWAGRRADRSGARRPLVIGPVIAAVGFALFAVPGVGSGYWLGFFPAVCVLGVGMGITVAPLTTTVMNAAGEQMAGVASGVNNAVSRTAAVLAIALFGVVMAAVFDAALSTRLEAMQLPPQARQAVLAQHDRLAAIRPPEGLGASQRDAVAHAVAEAFVAGFRVVMALCAALALLSAFSAWRLIDRGPRRTSPTAAGDVGLPRASRSTRTLAPSRRPDA